MEPAPEGVQNRAHQYIGARDTYDWDPSLDLYGGGLAATVGDLALFWRGLFSGKIFARATTLDTLLTTTIKPTVPGYRMGVFVRDFDGLIAYDHSGFWGTTAVYVPDLDLVVSGAVTEQEQGRAVFGLARAAIKRVRAEMTAR